MQREPIPRLPVFGWQAFEGHRQAGTPCLIDLPGLHYTTSGRAAILLALEVLGVGPGDQVLLPSYHCPTMVAPPVSLGALPRFYPIDANGTPHLAWLAAQDTTRVRVLLAAHYFGLPQPMGAMRLGKCFEEAPAKQSRKHTHRQEEAGLAGHPARAVRRQGDIAKRGQLAVSIDRRCSVRGRRDGEQDQQ